MVTPAPSPRMDAADALVSAIDQAAGTLTLAIAFAQGGRAIDLAGLDRDIGKICEDVLKLPPEQGYALRPALRTVLDLIDQMQQATNTVS